MSAPVSRESPAVLVGVSEPASSLPTPCVARFVNVYTADAYIYTAVVADGKVTFNQYTSRGKATGVVLASPPTSGVVVADTDALHAGYLPPLGHSPVRFVHLSSFWYAEAKTFHNPVSSTDKMRALYEEQFPPGVDRVARLFFTMQTLGPASGYQAKLPNQFDKPLSSVGNHGVSDKGNRVQNAMEELKQYLGHPTKPAGGFGGYDPEAEFYEQENNDYPEAFKRGWLGERNGHLSRVLLEKARASDCYQLTRMAPWREHKAGGLSFEWSTTRFST